MNDNTVKILFWLVISMIGSVIISVILLVLLKVGVEANKHHYEQTLQKKHKSINYIDITEYQTADVQMM